MLFSCCLRRNQAFLKLLVAGTKRNVAACRGNPHAVHGRASTRRDQTTNDDVFLQTGQDVLLTFHSGLCEDAGGFLEGCCRDERTCLQRSLGDAQQNRVTGCRRLTLGQLRIDCVHFFAVNLFAGKQGCVATECDFNLLQHLTNDRFDVLVVDLHALQTIHFLNFRNQIFSQCFDAHDFKDVMRVRRTSNQVIALTNEIAFLNIKYLRLLDQILNTIAFFRNNRDLALRLIVTDEFNAARNLRNDCVILRNTCFEQFGNAWQTTGDVAGLSRFTGHTSDNIACLNHGTVFNRKHRSYAEQITRSFTAIVIQQGNAWAKVFLLGAAAGTIFDNDALGDTRCFVGLLGQRLAVDQVLIFNDTRLFGDDWHGEWIPFSQTITNIDLRTIWECQRRTIRQTVNFHLAAILVDDDKFTVTGHRQALLTLVDDAWQIAIHDLTRCSCIKVRLFVQLRRTTDVEGTHGQLGSRLTDGLRSDNADSFTNVDWRTASKVTTVAGTANTDLGFAHQR